MQLIRTLSHFVLMIGCLSALWGQKDQKNTTDLVTYEELRNNFQKVQLDSVKARIYAETFLFIAKKNKDSVKMADAYHLLSQTYTNDLALKYADSVIVCTKNLDKHKVYPALGYLQKGNTYFNNGQYKKALNEYIRGSELAKTRNRTQYMTIRFNIGLLRNLLDEREESMSIFREYLAYVDHSSFEDSNLYYNKALYALADSFLHTKHLDSADVLISRGIQKTIRENDSIVYPYFVMGAGISAFHKTNYNVAVDSLIKAESLMSSLTDKTALTVCHLFIGQSLKELDRMEEALVYLKEVDSLIQDKNFITPKLLETYYLLIDYYEAIGDTKNQLYYLNNLIKFDSLLNTNHKYLLKNITKKYDTPELISVKQNLINRLQKDKFISEKALVYVGVLAVLLLFLVFYYLRRYFIFKKRFKKLIFDYEKKNKDSKLGQRGTYVRTDYENSTEELSDLRLSKEVIDEILQKLEHFENTNKFIKKNSSLSRVAKDLNTNSTYLSKIINVTRKTNFSNYLNDLRIDYVIKRLREDKQLRSYTVKAIAKEIGFNNSQSFSVAFRKKTGIYPSFFIKQLDDIESK